MSPGSPSNTVHDRPLPPAGPRPLAPGERIADPPAIVAADTRAHDHEILTREAKFADDLKREYPLVWWVTLVGPFVATAAVLVSLGLTRGWDFVIKLAGTALATFFAAGRFVILFGSDMKEKGEEASRFAFMTSRELFVMVTWMDLFVACMLIFHASFMFKIPKFGPAMLALREDGEFILQSHPWMKRFTLVGLAVFVAFPLAATGSVAGSIFGRLLGLSRSATLLGLIAGTFIGNGAMLLGKKVINQIPLFDKDNPLNIVGGVAVIVGLILLLNWRYRKMKREWAEKGRPSPPRA